MKYELIVSDMDGTLLGANHQITEKNKEALKKAIDKGIKVVIATGRIYDTAIPHFDFLENSIPIIACNGAIIRHDDKVLHTNFIETQVCKKIIDILEQHNIYYRVYTTEKVYSKESLTMIEKHKEYHQRGLGYMDITEVSNIYEVIKGDNVLKLVIIEEENLELLDKVQINASQIEELEVTKSFRSNVEIMTKGANKGNAIDMLSKTFNIDKDKIIAFGDNHNDISMLELVGMGVAMDNADEYIKSKANYVTIKNYESGVAVALEKLDVI